jgi:hypothetical protein
VGFTRGTDGGNSFSVALGAVAVALAFAPLPRNELQPA